MSPHYGKFVAYFRVSTDRQGKSGLGLDAQRQAVMSYLDGGRWTLVAEFTEVESGKRDDNRPQLAAAIAACKRQKARLVIAKLDRLSRMARGGVWAHVQVGAILHPFGGASGAHA